MRKDASAAMKATIRASGRDMGAELRVLLTALLFLAATDVRCSITADAQASGPTPLPEAENVLSFQQFEADALNAVLRNWTSGGLNQQLSSVLGWSLQEHPCNNTSAQLIFSDGAYKLDRYEGGWRGVVCSGFRTASNYTGNYYTVSVTSLILYGSNMSCKNSHVFPDQCGFDGIQGVLPSDIGGLTNLDTLTIKHHPKLAGAVPLQIWQMPNLSNLDASDNQLGGSFPLEILLMPGLSSLDVSGNRFSGSLDFSDFPFDFRYNLLNFSWNQFNGNFSSGPYLNPRILDISHNQFKHFNFDIHNGTHDVSMPDLEELYMENNMATGEFPMLILKASKRNALDVSGNRFSGSLDFSDFPFDFRYNLLNFSWNQFNGYFSSGPYLNPTILDISQNQFKHINFDIYNGTRDVSMPDLEELYVPSSVVFIYGVN